ncbi:MAG TPA: MgtC/SapB family protein [Phycisphaerales bacterium]|nr:MgtC/SapB family protein [Phycisphaerales bacterium]
MQLHEFLLNTGVSALLGAAIGWERELHQRKAGLRTNVLVAVGSAAFVTLGAFVPHEDSQSRVAAAVVSGVGFLGAGVIFKGGATIKGLDTAATVWCSAAVGALAGWGQIAASMYIAAIVLLTNTLVRPLVKRMDKRRSTGSEPRAVYRASVACAEKDDDDVRDLLLAGVSESDLLLRSIHRTKRRDAEDGVHHTITAELVGTGADRGAVERIASRLTADPRVESASWRVGDDAGDDGADANAQGDGAAPSGKG